MADQTHRYEISHDVLADAILDWRRQYEEDREAQETDRRLEEEKVKLLDEQRARHRARMYRLVGWGAAALLVLAIALAVAVFIAVRERRNAESEGLAAAARGQLETDPELSILLAREAYETEPTAESEEALRRALGASRLRERLSVDEPLVVAPVWSGDGELVAAGGERAVRIWRVSDGATEEVDGVLEPGGISDIAVGGTEDAAAEGENVVVAGGRHGVFALRPDSDSEATRLTPMEAWAVTASGDGRYVAAVLVQGRAGFRPHLVRVWDVETGRQMATARIPFAGFVDVAFNPDRSGSIAMASCDDFLNTMRVGNWRTGAVQTLPNRSVSTHQDIDVDGTRCLVEFSPDGDRLATAARSDDVRLWDVPSGRFLGAFDTSAPEAGFVNNGAGVEDVAWRPDGERLAVSAGKEVAVFDANEHDPESGGVPVGRLAQPHTDWAVSVAYSPDGSQIATGSFDGTARVWDAETGTLSADLRGHTGNVLGAGFSPSGSRLLTGSDDGTALIWDVRGGSVVGVHRDWVFDAAYSPDGERVATAGNDGRARLWTAAGRPLAEIDTGKPLRHTVAVNFDDGGDRLLVAGGGRSSYYDGRVIVADARTGDRIEGLKLFKPISDASFSSDGEAIVVSHEFGAPIVRNLETEETVPMNYPEGTGYLFSTSAGFGEEGDYVVAGGIDGIVRVFDASTGDQVKELTGHEGAVLGATFSDDSNRIVSYGLDRTARVWDAATGDTVAVLRGHTSWISGAAFSSDGSRVVTSSADKSVRVWEAESGAVLSVQRPHADTINSVAFSPDDTKILTASDDNTARVTTCNTCGSVGDLMALAEDRTTRPLSPVERSEFLGED